MKTQNNRNEDLARANPSMARPVLFVLALVGSAAAALMFAGLALTSPRAAIPPPSVLIVPGGNVYGLGERIVVYYDSRDPIIDEAGRGKGTFYLGIYTYNNETTRVGSFIERLDGRDLPFEQFGPGTRGTIFRIDKPGDYEIRFDFVPEQPQGATPVMIDAMAIRVLDRISDEGLQLTIAGVASDGLEVDLTVLTDPQLIDEQLPKSLRRASLELWRLEAGSDGERLARLEIDLRVEEQLEPIAGARESCTFFLRNRPEMPEKCFDRYKLKAVIGSGTFEVRLLHLGEVLRASRISITLD